MSALCFSTDLTSAEWAAWVQAIGSIVAILGAVGIAVWQSRRQLNNAIALQIDETRRTRLEIARTLLVLCKNSLKVMEHMTDQMPDREAVYFIAEGERHFDLGQLQRTDSAISAISLHSLPSTLVTPIMLASATLRQFREKVEVVLRLQRNMDAAAFEDFFRVRQEMQDSLRRTCDDIAKEMERLDGISRAV